MRMPTTESAAVCCSARPMVLLAATVSNRTVLSLLSKVLCINAMLLCADSKTSSLLLGGLTMDPIARPCSASMAEVLPLLMNTIGL